MAGPSLTQRSVTAAAWGGAGSAVRLSLQIGVQIVLARALGPEQYGLFAIGVIVISLSNFAADFGLAYGLIQREHVTEDHIRLVFTWQVLAGSVVSIALALCAEPIAALFKEPRSALIVAALAPVCVFQSVAAVSLNLLKRELDFRGVQIAQLTGYALGFLVVGLPMALLGGQVWALVVAWTIQSIVTTVLLYCYSRHAVRPLLRHPELRALGSFGLQVLQTNLLNWAVGNIERIVIARHLPVAQVGLYTTPYNLMYSPASAVAGVIQPVMYSACAKIQSNPEMVSKVYRTLTRGVSLALMPAFWTLAALAPTVVDVLYGAKWHGAADVLRPIALAMPFLLLWNITTPPLWTQGRAAWESRLMMPLAVAWGVAALVAVQHSVEAVAWAVLGLYVLRCAVFAFAVGRITGVGPAAYLRCAGPGVVLGVCSALTASAAMALLSEIQVIDAPLRLTISAALGAIAWVLAIRFMPTLLGPELAELMKGGIRRMPPPLRQLFAAIAGKGLA